VGEEVVTPSTVQVDRIGSAPLAESEQYFADGQKSVTNEPTASLPVAANEQAELAGYLKEAMGINTAENLASSGDLASSSLATGSEGSLTLSNNSGLSAFVSYDLASETGVKSAWFTLTVGGQDFISVPKLSLSEKIINSDNTTSLSYIATDLMIGDKTGKYDFIVIDDTVVSRSAVRMNLVFNSKGSLIDSTLSLTPRV
jgi:uncharacterized protein with GYD domain